MGLQHLVSQVCSSLACKGQRYSSKRHEGKTWHSDASNAWTWVEVRKWISSSRAAAGKHSSKSERGFRWCYLVVLSLLKGSQWLRIGSVVAVSHRDFSFVSQERHSAENGVHMLGFVTSSCKASYRYVTATWHSAPVKWGRCLNAYSKQVCTPNTFITYSNHARHASHFVTPKPVAASYNYCL
jgi:hypothetical protein